MSADEWRPMVAKSFRTVLTCPRNAPSRCRKSAYIDGSGSAPEQEVERGQEEKEGGHDRHGSRRAGPRGRRRRRRRDDGWWRRFGSGLGHRRWGMRLEYG